jgi:hypothetical protein
MFTELENSEESAERTLTTKTMKIHKADKKMAVNFKEDKEGKMSKDSK